ncbi:protogenin A-like [Anticarsia gemmatalis]|uniref:protogenin A-like n=1 Tax=Anticarsia gemmatalis TaxID=129554 RepID=UPI003F776842
MAVTLLRVLVLGVIAAAADDVPITWSSPPRASLPCAVPDADKITARRPPPPLDADAWKRPSPTLIWKKGGKELTTKLKNGALDVLRKKDGSSEGVYQCQVRHQTGFVLGLPMHLKFAHLDKQFRVSPENSTAVAGQPFVLSCAINSGPAALVSWQRDGEPLPQNDRYFVLNNQLLILDVRKEDVGLYRCKATNPLAKRPIQFSNSGRLEVEDSAAVDAEPSFLALQYDSTVSAGRGDRVALPCPVTGYPRPKIIWEFHRPGERISELEDTSEVLVLEQLDPEQEGAYVCTVEGRSDLERTFNVIIPVPVNITLPPTSKQVPRASTVRFNCTAVGNPPPTITWYKNGEPLVLADRIVVRASANDEKRMELLIRTVTSEDSGVYQCFAHNGLSWWSAWATLDVTGAGAAAPAGVRCWAAGARRVLVRWPHVNDSMAYTLQISSPGGQSLPSQPHTDTEETATLNEALTPYRFQVRAYIQSSKNNKNIASDMSESVTCQGQGVPIRFSRKGNDVLVSWRQFALQTPGVKQWILQYKVDNTTEEQNVTLGAAVTNYTITMSSPTPLQIRVLGTRQLPWLQQDLSLVPWTSTVSSNTDADAGDQATKIDQVQVTEVGSRDFTVQWHCEEAETSPETYVYLLCTKKQDEDEDCEESLDTQVRVDNLWPGTEYSVRVKVKSPLSSRAASEFTQPIRIVTQPDGEERIKDLTYKVINASTLRVSWNSVPDKYRVYYKNKLELPINQWPSVETVGNTVVLSGVDLYKELYVMVSGYEPVGHSSVLKIPPQVSGMCTSENTKESLLYHIICYILHPNLFYLYNYNSEATDLKYTFTNDGVTCTWEGQGPRVVRYSQNLTQPVDKWTSVNVSDNSVHITGLDSSLKTYVMVWPAGAYITIPEPPESPMENLSFYIMVGLGVGVLILCLLFVAAVCIWHHRRKTRSPVRNRSRRSVSLTEGHEEEGAEMKNVGSQLANGGGSKDAGEPLLNGHVHITENPNQSKTPNGRMRKGRRYEQPFDVARYEDPDTTLETVLDDTSSTTFNLLDTSRRPEYDLSRSSRDLSANNSFNKLPDDNMNSELTRSTDFQLDNSKILPTLQPNG